MEFNVLVFIACMIFLPQDACAMSIDQILSGVEKAYEKKIETEILPRSSIRPDWYEYSLFNRTEKLVKLQHDMIITKDMWDNAINSTEELPQKRRQKRNAIRWKDLLWTRRISYRILDGFSDKEKLTLLESMNHWEEYTCLKFVEAKDTDRDIIVFTPMEGVCESFVGRMEGQQPINLDKGCMQKKILIHEIGHALGFYHEHMRADRDQYVFINYTNINDTKEAQFDPLLKDEYNDYNKTYDYYSIMHYGKLFFSINATAGLVTIKPKDEKFLNIIGSSPSLSYRDMIIANDLYKCSAGCPLNTCEGGFIGGSNCECFCQKKNSFDVRICGTQACTTPAISPETYDVYDVAIKVVVFQPDSTFPHGTKLHIYRKDLKCGNEKKIYQCTDGVWQGDLPPCRIARMKAPCVINYDVNKYVVTYNGGEINNGDHIQPDDMVNVTCRHGDQGDEPTAMYCNDGEWDYDIEILKCLVPQKCPVVVNAAITGSYERGFKVECLPRHALVTNGEVPNLFTCSFEGRWEPFTPICDPKNCTRPADDVHRTIILSNGIELNAGDIVAHGITINLRCPRSYIPDSASFTCEYGLYNTADGNLPRCVQVTCSLPPVKATVYEPKKVKYLYGDEVSIGRCRGKTYLEGDNKLHCTRHGTWSGKAECITFCPSHNDTYGLTKNHVLLPSVPGASITMKVITIEYCQQLCTNSWKKRRYRKRLCGAYVYGYNRTKKYFECRLYFRRPADLIDHKGYEIFWTLGIRQCG
ncbi:hypothetical protein ACF0H5_021841 [Mactra antiquata]